MSYQAITDIIVNPQLQDLQLSNPVKDSPKTSVSFSDFLASFQKNEVKNDEKAAETAQKPEDTAKSDVKKEESALDSRVENKEKADDSEKVTEKTSVDEKSEDKKVAKESSVDDKKSENQKNLKTDAKNELSKLEKSEKTAKDNSKDAKKLTKKDFSRMDELTNKQKTEEITENTDKQSAIAQNFNNQKSDIDLKSEENDDSDLLEIAINPDSSKDFSENLKLNNENNFSETDFDFSKNNKDAKKEFALDKDGKIIVEDLRSKIEADSDSDKKSVIHTSDIKLTGENTALMSVELNPNAQADVLSLNTQTAASNGSNFQAMLSNQLHNVAPEFVKAGNLILKDNNQGTINLVLHPDDLGNVKIHLSLDGKTLSGHITVATKEALQVFKDNSETLREAFIKNGFDVANFDVSMNNGGSFNQNMGFEGQNDGTNLLAKRMYGNSAEGLSAEMENIFKNAEDISNYSVNIVA